MRVKFRKTSSIVWDDCVSITWKNKSDANALSKGVYRLDRVRFGGSTQPMRSLKLTQSILHGSGWVWLSWCYHFVRSNNILDFNSIIW